MRALSLAKTVLLAPVPPKLYWHLMGRFRAVPAVTSECTTLEASLASGKVVVALLDAAGVLQPDAVVLQIGSGLGRVEKHLATRVTKCFGADISPSMVAQAKALVPEHNVEFRCIDGRCLSGWEDDSLDLVFSVYVFQHLARQQVSRYLHEAFRCLRPGGSLLFQVLIDEEGSEKEPPAGHPYALRYYRRNGLTETLEAAGFRDVRTLGLDGSADRGAAHGDLVFIGLKPSS